MRGLPLRVICAGSDTWAERGSIAGSQIAEISQGKPVASKMLLRAIWNIRPGCQYDVRDRQE